MSQSRFIQGFQSLQAGQFDEAVAAFEEVLKDQPDLAEAHFNLALAHLALDNLEEARALRAKLQDLDPALAAELGQEIKQWRCLVD